MPLSQEIHPGFETRSRQGPRELTRGGGTEEKSGTASVVRVMAVADAQAVKHFRFTAAIMIAILSPLRASISDLHVLRGKGEKVLLSMSP